MIKELKVQEPDTAKFIADKVSEIVAAAGNGPAINSLPGGVDSSVVTIPGHKAPGNKLRKVLIRNGLMREGEAV